MVKRIRLKGHVISLHAMRPSTSRKRPPSCTSCGAFYNDGKFRKTKFLCCGYEECLNCVLHRSWLTCPSFRKGDRKRKLEENYCKETWLLEDEVETYTRSETLEENDYEEVYHENVMSEVPAEFKPDWVENCNNNDTSFEANGENGIETEGKMVEYIDLETEVVLSVSKQVEKDYDRDSGNGSEEGMEFEDAEEIYLQEAAGKSMSPSNPFAFKTGNVEPNGYLGCKYINHAGFVGNKLFPKQTKTPSVMPERLTITKQNAKNRKRKQTQSTSDERRRSSRLNQVK